ncbi:hypothetical protein [Pseudomonas sp. KNUC1026]|uniref:hypothetical protein n=1 Tax=Pseudomonas sp. KNUC1026 TaxID=2893890 RepID=UPI001F348E5F|nr:hypothetical protein [Pseudomonas sp. KNUC1026]UFH48277.1 hypothetical protein LN139_13995 [Pseudomonas sp. KNUC1026]
MVTIQIHYDDGTGGDEKWVVVGGPYPVDENTAVPNFDLPAGWMKHEGKIALRLHVEQFTGDEFFSDALNFITDITPPFGRKLPPAPILSPELVTQEYLDDGNKIQVKIAPYPDFQPGDKVQVFWAFLTSGNISYGPITDPLEMTATEFSVDLPTEAATERGSGTYLAAAYFADKAGNISLMSDVDSLGVVLGAMATGMAPPSVPLAQAAQDDFLSLEDAYHGVEVHIPAFLNVQQGDAIRLYWGTQPGYDFIPSRWPFPDAPLAVAVPNTLLASDYGNHTGKLDTDVAYEVTRGGFVMGTRQSTMIQVDFSIKGPVDPDPDWPDPVNEALTPADIRSTSGKPNRIEKADRGQPAQLKVTLHKDIEVGQPLKFYLGEFLLVEHPVKAGEPGTEISVQVPWLKIEACGNGIFDLYYHLITTTSGNYWKSPSVKAVVAANVIAPLVMKTPAGGDMGKWLACSSLVKSAGEDGIPAGKWYVKIQTPDLSRYLAKGDEVELHWEPFIGYTDKPAHAPFIATVTFDDKHPVTGFIWKLPYDPHVLSIYTAGFAEGTNYGVGKFYAEFSAWGNNGRLIWQSKVWRRTRAISPVT